MKNKIKLSALLTLVAFVGLADYGWKSEMTVTGYAGSTTLTNFPVLVRISPERVSGFSYLRCQADGKDIKFTSTDGETVYPHEIDEWNADGESLVWVRLPELSGTSTAFTFWFGDAAVEEAASGTNTWSSAADGFYGGVWHFAEQATAETAASVNNADSAKHKSTVNMRFAPMTGTGTDIPAMVSVDGPIGYGRQMATNTAAALKPNGLVAGGRPSAAGVTGNFTFSTWMKFKAVSIWTVIAGVKLETSRTGWWLQVDNAGKVLTLNGDGAAAGVAATYSSSGLVSEGWFHLAASVDRGTGTVVLYKNGEVMGTGTLAAPPTTDYSVFGLGRTPYRMAASFDETRLLSTIAPADWVKAEYDTAAADDFVTAAAATRVAGDDTLVVTADPELLGGDAISVPYGMVTDFTNPILFTAPDADVAISDTLHIQFTGWELQRQDNDGIYQTIDSAATNAYLYVHEGGCMDRFVWKFIRKFPLSLEVSPTGSGSFLVDGVATAPGTAWITEGVDVLTVAPVAASGYDFIWWGGSRYGNVSPTLSVAVAAGRVTEVVATFLSNGAGHSPVTVGWGGANGAWLSGERWVGGVVPQLGDTVLLTNAAARTVTLVDTLPRFAKLVLTNTTLVVSNWMSRIEADEIIVGAGSTIKVAGSFADGAMSNRVWLAGGSLTVASGGKILADEAGYAYNAGPAWAAYAAGAKTREACGTYGEAYGGMSVKDPPRSYGDARHPSDPGSGPGSALNQRRGAGGGAIRLDFTGDVVIDGTISAIGSKNETSVAGSGGAVWITCRTVSGGGKVTAGGGDSAAKALTYCGGGGRVAVDYEPSAQSNVACRVAFSANGGVSYDQIGSRACVPGTTLIAPGYFRSVEDCAPVSDPGTLYFPDNQFLFAACYREMGLPFQGTWVSDEPLSEFAVAGDLVLTNTCLKFTSPVDFTVGGNLSVVGSGYYARRNFGLIFTDSTVHVGGNLSLTGARIELRGGSLVVDGNVEQLSLTGNGNPAGTVTTKFAGGEIALKAAPTNAPSSFGATLNIGGTWHMGNLAVTCPFAAPNNGAVVMMRARSLTLDAGASIDADEKGYAMWRGPGTSPSAPTTGASHGGKGGASSVADLVNVRAAYDSAPKPVQPGSGGYSTHTYAGFDGGGVVLLEVERDFVFNGNVTADGNTRLAGLYAGGSSGGTVNIKAGRLTGSTGKIRAQGGFCGASGDSSYGKTGGGGRIAVRYGETDWTEEMKAAATCVLPGGAYGAISSYSGAEEGTVFWGVWRRGMLMIFY